MIYSTHIPREMKEMNNWVCWRGEWVQQKDGTRKKTKIPYDPKTGNHAKSNDAETWADFQTALKAGAKADEYDGIGFMFKGSGLVGVDIDGIPQVIEDYKHGKHDNIVGELLDSLQTYAETSQSGGGLHIIGKGNLPGADFKNDKVGIEMYTGNRFFVVTGDTAGIPTMPLKDVTEPIKAVYERYKTKRTGKKEKPTGSIVERHRPIEENSAAGESYLTEDDVIEKACNHPGHGERFQALFGGDVSEYDSQSNADLALCNFLAFWTNKNPQMMDSLFRQSGLYREKWDRKTGDTTYGAMTIQKAIEDTENGYNPHRPKASPKFRIGVKAVPTKSDVPEINPEKVRMQSFDDIGNAWRFYDQFGDIVRWHGINNAWYFYSTTTGRWREDNIEFMSKLGERVTEAMKDYEQKLYENQEPDNSGKEQGGETDYTKALKAFEKHLKKTRSNAGQENMIKRLKNIDPFDSEKETDVFDKDDNIFNCKNGVINLDTGELLPHDKAYLCTMQSPIEYDENAPEPKKWIQFLKDIFGDDIFMLDYIQKAVGYTLSGYTKEQCFFILYGIGRNGKSTFLDVIRKIFGGYAANAQAETLMVTHKTGNQASSDVARLAGKRFVTSSEPDEGMRLASGLIKQLTGGESVTARKLFASEFEFEPKFKLWFATNAKPKIVEQDDGIWRRIKLIPFTKQIPEEKVDIDLKEKLLAEAPGILRWAVEGYRKWKSERLGLPQQVKKAVQEYRTEMDRLSMFISERCELIHNASTQASVLYQKYEEWCKNNGENPMSNTMFGRQLSKRTDITKKNKGKYFVYEGIKLI